MQTLRQIIKEAEDRKVAIGHFNFSNLEGLWAIFRGAKNLGVPVIAGLSEGERDFVGVSQAVALVKSLRDEYDYPIFLSADHTYSFERAKEAIDAGFDLIVFDRSELPLEENIAETKKCVAYAREINPEIMIEGELGHIGKSSKMLDEIPEGTEIEGEALTKAEDAQAFVSGSGVDLFSPAVGNLHGMLKHAPNPRLDLEKIKELKSVVGVPIILHGGSGTSDEDLLGAVQAGVSVIHINTELRLAYRQALVEFLQENPDEIAPYKILKNSIKVMRDVVEKRLKLFSGLG